MKIADDDNFKSWKNALQDGFHSHLAMNTRNLEFDVAEIKGRFGDISGVIGLVDIAAEKSLAFYSSQTVFGGQKQEELKQEALSALDTLGQISP